MLFPNSAKNAIAKSFYDKTVEVLATEDIIDTEGGVIKGSLTTKCTLQGNVRFANLGEIQSELGLVDSIDICITCGVDENVSVNDLLRCSNKLYVATSVIPSDSHLTIVGKLWEVQE